MRIGKPRLKRLEVSYVIVNGIPELAVILDLPRREVVPVAVGERATALWNNLPEEGVLEAMAVEVMEEDMAAEEAAMEE